MDERRFRELDRKRFKGGLTVEEADELGQMMAERDGRPYGNAAKRAHPDSLPEGGPEQPSTGEGPSSETLATERGEHPDLQEAEEEKAS